MTATADHTATAAKLMVFDFEQRTADPEDAAPYRARVEEILDGPNAGAVLRSLLDLIAETNTVEARQASIERCRALAFIDAGVLEDQARGVRHPGKGCVG